MISHSCKIIYIHIPKCAGRSICRAFNEDFDHYTASYYQTHHSQWWQQYTVFTTVRNPYQRLLSMYHYIKNEPVHAGDAITNFGNMPPFKNWVVANIDAFKGEFEHPNTEGSRETHGDMGSAFWFSSQWQRLCNLSQTVNPEIHIIRYEDGMQQVCDFIHRHTGTQLHIPHLNRSHNNTISSYLQHYDQELLDTVNNFAPFAKDCRLLEYDVIKSTTE